MATCMLARCEVFYIAGLGESINMEHCKMHYFTSVGFLNDTYVIRNRQA